MSSETAQQDPVPLPSCPHSPFFSQFSQLPAGMSVDTLRLSLPARTTEESRDTRWGYCLGSLEPTSNQWGKSLESTWFWSWAVSDWLSKSECKWRGTKRWRWTRPRLWFVEWPKRLQSKDRRRRGRPIRSWLVHVRRSRPPVFWSCRKKPLWIRLEQSLVLGSQAQSPQWSKLFSPLNLGARLGSSLGLAFLWKDFRRRDPWIIIPNYWVLGNREFRSPFSLQEGKIRCEIGASPTSNRSSKSTVRLDCPDSSRFFASSLKPSVWWGSDSWRGF